MRRESGARTTGTWVRRPLRRRRPPHPYLAAHRALFHTGQARPADRVLVRGASGAVGLAAVHLARRCGGDKRVIVGTAAPEEVAGAWGARIRHWGADAVVAHDHDSVAGHGPFDVVVEQVARFNLASDVSLLAPGGRVVIVGSPPQADGASLSEFDARQLMTREASVRGLFLWRQTAEERREASAAILRAWDGWSDEPPVHRMPLSDAVAAGDG